MVSVNVVGITKLLSQEKELNAVIDNGTLQQLAQYISTFPKEINENCMRSVSQFRTCTFLSFFMFSIYNASEKKSTQDTDQSFKLIFDTLYNFLVKNEIPYSSGSLSLNNKILLHKAVLINSVVLTKIFSAVVKNCTKEIYLSAIEGEYYEILNFLLDKFHLNFFLKAPLIAESIRYPRAIEAFYNTGNLYNITDQDIKQFFDAALSSQRYKSLNIFKKAFLIKNTFTNEALKRIHQTAKLSSESNWIESARKIKNYMNCILILEDFKNDFLHAKHLKNDDGFTLISEYPSDHFITIKVLAKLSIGNKPLLFSLYTVISKLLQKA